MSSTSPHEYFGFKCPAGGQFHICLGAKVEFIGCCISDPCADDSGICPPEDMRWSAFDPERYEDLPPQTCNSSEGASNWYTCKFGSPPFMGCCAGNPCASDGCPRTQLVPAQLSDNQQMREQFLDPEGSKTDPGEPSGTPSPTGSPTDGARPPEEGVDSGLSSGAIAGISAGAAAVALLLFAFLFWRFWWLPRRTRGGSGYEHASPGSPSIRDSGYSTDPPKYHAAPLAEVDGDRTGIQEIGTSQHFRHELAA